MLVSVIVPAHNEGENLNRLLPRLRQLGAGFDYEVIVSIGVSTDVANPPPTCDKVVWVTDRRKGRACQMNLAAHRAKGSVLVFLHADVWPPSGFFEDLQHTVTQGYDAGFFSYRFDKSTRLLNINASFTKSDGFFTGGGDQCLFITASAFRSLNGFDENFVIMEDFEFFKRMKKRGLRYTIVDNALTVSARKYEKNSYLRINATNLILVVLFKLGCRPARLKRIHDTLLDVDYSETASASNNS
ncbi:glycosyltransferase [Flagellimonas sp. DF-77]|uniref:glycosyltransferase n=1 Tax=Flagellimonas algarum TaxID=3230298 RepID=UPI00339A725C